ncbi:MAG: hypothetical protein E6K15_00375 [Methanobacteriota archaeon]|nr:MAG: hypothetical protein E6K15_00375 [Euryarchaeota archaeon]
MRCRMLLAGFGNVGREFARLILERRSELARVHGLDATIVAILTGRHGSVERSQGIDLRKALRLADAGASLESCGRGVRGPSADYIRRARADVVIEITPLRIAPRQIGVDHVLAALSSGKHVITANKGPVVYHYQRLRALARKHGLGFRYEGTVMDGAPVFNLFQETLRGIRILREGEGGEQTDEAHRPWMADRTDRTSRRVPRIRPDQPSALLRGWDVELSGGADGHAERAANHRAASGFATDRLCPVFRSPRNSRGPSVSLRHSYIVSTGWSAECASYSEGRSTSCTPGTKLSSVPPSTRGRMR